MDGFLYIPDRSMWFFHPYRERPSMRRKLLTTLAVIGLVAAAGCTIPGGGGSTGTVDTYVSDQPNAIDDFEHLNVTVTMVGFHEASNQSWIAYNTTRTVDLTRLQGDNATLLGSFPVPAGNYTKVFIHVSNVTGTLKSGQPVTVTVPSNTLQVSTPFTIESGETVSFVYDLSVVKQGSHSYTVLPQATESGPNQPVDPIENASAPTA